MATPSPNNMLNFPPTLPFDVLCEIFKSYIEDYYHTRPFSLLRASRDIPWFLSHICRHWRIAAIATPQLWKRFPPLKSTAQSDSLSDNLNSMFDELLTRSGAHPIHVQFDFAQGTKGSSDTKPYPALVPLLAASRRWEEVTIHCPVGDTVYFREIEGRIPCLRRAEVLLMDGKWPDEVRIDPKLRPMNILSDAPMLSELLLDRNIPFTVPWGQMIKLQLYYPQDIYEILKCAEDLDTLMLVDCGYPNKQRPSLERAKLRKFYIHIQHSKWGLSNAVDELELPALETFVLTVDPTWPFEENMMYDLRSLFIRSGCNLQHLVFYGAVLKDQRVLNLLEATPDLQTLELGNCADLDEVLLRLVFEETKTTLLPYLHTLTLSFHYNINRRHTMIIRRIVESRAQVVGEGSEDFPGLLFSALQNVAVRTKISYIRFQVCFDLNDGAGAPGDPLPEADMSYPIWPFDNTVEFEHISEFTRNCGDSEQNIAALNERQLADILRFQHTSERPGSRNSLRKACQSLVTRTEDFIKTYKWMLVGEQYIVYIHPEHELRNTPNCWDIAFGMIDGGLESLEGYRDSELLAERREWWNC